MGADIHCYLEYAQDATTGPWLPFGGRIDPGRIYSVYAALANVRNPGNVQAMEPRGLGFRAWVTANELEVALKRSGVHAERAPEYMAIVAAMRSFESQGFHARMVFWFDN